MKRFIAAALFASCLAGCAPIESQPKVAASTPIVPFAGSWHPVGATTGRTNDPAVLAELATAFPDAGVVQARHFNILAEPATAATARTLLEEIARRSYRFSANAEKQINGFFAANGFPDPLTLTMRPGDVLEASRIIGTVPMDVLLPEAVLREQATGDLYVTSIVSRGLYRGVSSGQWRKVDLGQTGSLGGILQAADGTIWVSSAVYEPTPEPESAYRGLIGFKPGKGVVRRIAAPPDVIPSDIAIAPDGTLFAADPTTGAIYRAARESDSLETFVAPGMFRSAQGMAVSADNKFLYVSDYGYGLAVIDLRNGRIDRLPAPNSPFVDGTDGLWLVGDNLVGVQNGARPMRIAIHRLAPDGRSIASSRILESAHSGWTEPGSGSISRGELVYVGTGQWDRFVRGGLLAEGKQAIATQIRVLPLTK